MSFGHERWWELEPLSRRKWSSLVLIWVFAEEPRGYWLVPSSMLRDLNCHIRKAGHPEFSGEMGGWWTFKESNILCISYSEMEKTPTRPKEQWISVTCEELVLISGSKEKDLGFKYLSTAGAKKRIAIWIKSKWRRDFAEAVWIAETLKHSTEPVINVSPLSSSKSSGKG